MTGKLRTVWAFVMVLACSRHMFVRPVIKMDQRAWTECHVAAFAFFGGVPARLVPDNLKTGVDKPDLYDPKINRSYAELAAHYGCLVDPARARKPRDKARVERPMPYVRDSFWRGREFTSLAQMQAEADRWSRRSPGSGRAGRWTGAAPAAVFEAVEKDALAPLPNEPFVLATWATAKIGPDIHAQVGRVLYSVPWQHIGKTADVRLTATMVQFFIGGQLVKTHPRKTRGKQTDFGDYPPEKIAFHMRTPAWCRRQAAADRPGLRAGHRRAAGRQRALPAARRPGRGRPGRQARPGPARSRLRQGDRPPVTRPTGPSRASWPPAPSATTARRGRGRRRRGVPARPRVVRQRRPHARRGHQRRRPRRQHGAGHLVTPATTHAAAPGTGGGLFPARPLAAQAHALRAAAAFIERTGLAGLSVTASDDGITITGPRCAGMPAARTAAVTYLAASPGAPCPRRRGPPDLGLDQHQRAHRRARRPHLTPPSSLTNGHRMTTVTVTDRAPWPPRCAT